MQFLRTFEGNLIPETHIVEISSRCDAGENADNGDPVPLPHHRILTTGKLDLMEEYGGNRYEVASAREVARFVKACEAPDAPARRSERERGGQ